MTRTSEVYLVDTNIISVAAPSRRSASQDLIAWMDVNSSALYLSAVTVAEIASGIAKTRREGAGQRADDLEAWLETVLHLYGDRVLPLDIGVAQVAGRLADLARSLGRPPGFDDVAIAATAAHHRLTLLTRNTRHFEPLGVALLDPFLATP